MTFLNSLIRPDFFRKSTPNTLFKRIIKISSRGRLLFLKLILTNLLKSVLRDICCLKYDRDTEFEKVLEISAWSHLSVLALPHTFSNFLVLSFAFSYVLTLSDTSSYLLILSHTFQYFPILSLSDTFSHFLVLDHGFTYLLILAHTCSYFFVLSRNLSYLLIRSHT